jgi:hypothetical protein
MKGQGHYAFVCFQAQGTQGIVLVSHAFKQINTIWPCPSPIQKELVKFFLCEFRLICRHSCVEDFRTCVRSRSTIDKTTVIIYSVGQVSVFRDPPGPGFRSFSDAQPSSFFITFFFTTDLGRVSKN